MTLTKDILKIIGSARQGMTPQEVFNWLEYYDDPATFKVMLCRLVSRGLLRTDGRRVCDSCGSPHTVYRITDEGRMHLHGGDYNTYRVKKRK